MKSFAIPDFYKSPLIGKIKESRKASDPRKKDFSPTLLDFGSVRFFLARHFGFCYGVENAIEIAFKAVEENPNKKIYLLSQMIHNQDVNKDLINLGVEFLMDTSGKQLIEFEKLTSDNIVIIPAFGTTLEIEKKLSTKGIEVHKYNTTCPFVERVWKKSEKLGEDNYTIIIHGKYNHEETRATFSRSEKNAPSVIIKDIDEAKLLGNFILEKNNASIVTEIFKNRISNNFNFAKHLKRVGVINQTTMLATETQEIANYFKAVMLEKYGSENLKDHFSDTRDTLCYATNENQDATYKLLEQEADIALVVGGYNSSNTSHIAELCEKRLPTYFISSASEIVSKKEINHFDYHKNQHKKTQNYLPSKTPVSVLLTSGASCPDSIIEEVLRKMISFYPEAHKVEDVLLTLNN